MLTFLLWITYRIRIFMVSKVFTFKIFDLQIKYLSFKVEFFLFDDC